MIKNEIAKTDREKKIKEKINLIILAILTILCYGNTLFNDFVYDDSFVIEKSDFIKNFSNAKMLFSKDYFKNTIELSYRPLVTLTYFIDFHFWKLNPIGYHITNVVLHLFCVITVYFLIRSFFKERYISLIAAALFTVHPINTEAVNAISFREDLLAAFFFILSFLCYIKLEQANSKKVYCLYISISALSLFLGLFSKESVLVFPLVIIAYHLIIQTPSQNIKSIKLLSYIPIWAASLLIIIFYIIIRFIYLVPANKELIPDLPQLGGSISASIFNFPTIFNYYISLMVLPIKLRADYCFDGLQSLVSLRAIFSYLLFITFITIAGICVRKNKYVSFSMLWMLFSLAPVSNIIPISNPIAERYLYLTSIGFVLLAAAFINYCVQKKIFEIKIGGDADKIISGCVVFVIIIIPIYLGLTIRRNLEWGDEKLLWTSNLKLEPNSARSINGVASANIREGEIEKAKVLIIRGINLHPKDYKLRSNLGIVYAMEKKIDLAIEQFNKADTFYPNNKNTQFNLAKCYIIKQDYAKAYLYLQKAKMLGYKVPESLENKIKVHITVK